MQSSAVQIHCRCLLDPLGFSLFVSRPIRLPTATMPVRIVCTISFSTDDDHRGGYDKDAFDDHYKRVRGFGDGDSLDYLDGGSQAGEEEEESGREVDDLATFFSNCSLHGANHVFVEEKKFGIRQGLWALVFLLALSTFLLQVADRVIYYLQYDRITMLDEMTAPNMTFPAVTVCNYNFIRKSQMSYSDLIFMGQLLAFEEGMAPGFPLAPEPDRPPGSRFSLDEFYNRTRHRIEDMLLECKFRGLECGPESFSEVRQVKKNISEELDPFGTDHKWTKRDERLLVVTERRREPLKR